jgi:glyoxylase-like metal-dependent hydrolase (beta-lactamase superfamily II)
MAARIIHLNCMSFCPPGRRLMDGRSGAKGPAVLSCHCLLVELEDKLILVDTGYGVEDVRHPRPRLSPLFLDILCRPQLYERSTALRQIEKLGHRAEDVTDIVLTHLDFDHAGGLDDFPRARVHMLEAEKTAAVAQRTWLDKARFRPLQWLGSFERWRTYSATGERWYGFEAARGLEGLPPEILFVPLIGHTFGHAGIAIQRDNGSWMLHTGDAYFFRGEMDPKRPHCTPGLRFYQSFMEVDRDKRLRNQARLRELVEQHGNEVQVFCAHDIVEFETLKKISTAAPSREIARDFAPASARS